MPKTQYTKTALKEAIAGKLQRHFACEVEDATKDQVYEACALVVRDALTEHMIETQNEVEQDGERQVHYLCMEFLVGRSLRNNAYNLGMLDALTAALKDMGFEMADIFEEEADPGLGNGGLGRLAACYMDGMATDGVRGTGYSIRYEHGIFKQKIVEGQQVELPDSWLSTGEVWQIPAMDETREVKIGGTVDTYFDDNGKLVVNYHDYTPVLAVPYDMPISGYGTNNIARLRLWKAQSPIALDMKLFSSGEYLKALEKHALAETISMVLYPEDNHREGQSLRLKQQYFLVSATLQDICAKHKAKYGTLENFAHKHVLHINDTHPPRETCGGFAAETKRVDTCGFYPLGTPVSLCLLARRKSENGDRSEIGVRQSGYSSVSFSAFSQFTDSVLLHRSATSNRRDITVSRNSLARCNARHLRIKHSVPFISVGPV